MNVSAQNYKYKFYSEGECVLFGKVNTVSSTWGLWFGIHRGTFMGRNEDAPLYGYSSYDHCLAALKRNIKQFAGQGYYISYAIAIAPDGKQHKMLDGALYD